MVLALRIVAKGKHGHLSVGAGTNAFELCVIDGGAAQLIHPDEEKVGEEATGRRVHEEKSGGQSHLTHELSTAKEFRIDQCAEVWKGV